MKSKRMSASALLVVMLPFIFGITSATIVASLQSIIRVSSSASVKVVGIEAYWDFECTQLLGDSGIDWGIIEPGAASTVNFYLYNPSNVPVTVSFVTENWNPPEAELFMTLAWNSSSVVALGNIEPVSMTLSVSNTVQNITDFQFDILIMAEG